MAGVDDEEEEENPEEDEEQGPKPPRLPLSSYPDCQQTLLTMRTTHLWTTRAACKCGTNMRIRPTNSKKISKICAPGLLSAPVMTLAVTMLGRDWMTRCQEYHALCGGSQDLLITPCIASSVE